MSNITRLNKLLVNDNMLSNVNGLSSLTEVTEHINIQGNRYLKDITGLANISSGIIYINNEKKYKNKIKERKIQNIGHIFATFL
ncbi:hypothetical protein [Mesonia mobilis]|uniref:hypothetical protein n=1 Tax=Mesonia mobilis TaxID=369791 RepID=UPI0026EA9C78|nr:hypothetical protein [Mesonia mobilis]